MKLHAVLVAGALCLSAGSAYAEKTGEKVEKGARHTGKTMAHGTTSVGKGVSKIYHDGASRLHKLIAKNRKSDRAKTKHMSKSQAHYQHAARKAGQSQREMDRAEKHADQVTR